jgi:magnesium transporter
MIRILGKDGRTFVELKPGPDFSLPADTVWIDLLNPTREEEVNCEAAVGVPLPTREEMAEIESSSRLYKEGAATVMTAAVLANSDTPIPIEGPVTFVLVDGRLVTIRYFEPKAFKIFAHQLLREPEICTSGVRVFTGLLDALIDRLADVLERSSADVETLSSEVFGTPGKVNFTPVMRRLGRSQNVNAKARDSLVSLARLIGFAMLADPVEADPESRGHLKSLQRDVVSLTDHSSYLAGNITFLLDAALGLINIEQNGIIKFFSVAAVIFLPPTLVTSYFGMNFKNMPELDWRIGEPFAIVLMIASVIVPLLWFKRRGWL